MGEYTVKYAEDLARRLLAKPVPEAPQDLNKQGVVKHILPEIQILLERGFTVAQLAESMREEEFEITTPTLKSYLQRANGKKTSKKARRRTPPEGPPAAASPTT